MECKNCGKETKIRVDDGPGASHVEEPEQCMKCQGWMVDDYVNIYDMELSSIVDHADFQMIAVHWRDGEHAVYVDGVRQSVRKSVRYRKLKRFFKLLFNRNLRRRLERFQIAYGRCCWQGHIVPDSIVMGDHAWTSEEIMKEYEQDMTDDNN